VLDRNHPRGKARSALQRAVALIALSTLAAPALAQPTAPPAPPPGNAPKPADTALPTEAPAPTEEAKQEARAHFAKGIALLQEEAWAAALAEFQISRELFPTRVATNNAGVALRKLQRFDESLDMFEAFLRDFPNIPPGERTLAQRAVAELRDLVGTVEVAGAEPGAFIVISGQDKGEYPPVKPLRVSAGTHTVRIFKEGFEPYETRVDVAGGQTAKVMAKLPVLKQSGRLKVTERGGRAINVVVDNVVVGKTPWEGVLAVGNHTVLLRGDLLQGETKLGTQPATTPVKSGEVTALTLVAEDLEAALRVEPTPAGATVAIDSVTVGRGIWLGRLRAGTHQVEVRAEGFLPVSKRVNIERGGRLIEKIPLPRDPNAEVWRKPSKVFFDASVGLTIVPTFGGDVAGAGCSGDCSRSVGLGALGLFHGGYELGSGFGVGLTAGYLIAAQSVTERKTELVPNGKDKSLPAQEGVADDRLRLSAFLGGATASYHLGERYPVLIRAGVGALLGQVRDERQGDFRTRKDVLYKTYTVVDFPKATYLYINPEVRGGIRLGDHFELTGGLQVLMLLALSQPRWNEKIEVAASTDGIGTYRSGQVMGDFVLTLTPTVDLRYDF
jgi:hypothetical protein